MDESPRLKTLTEALSVSPSTVDARIVQVVLLVAVLADALLRAGAGATFGPPLAVGMAAVVAATLVVLLVAPDRMPRWVVAGCAVVDLLGVGMSRVDDSGVGVITLAALPAYFLGRHFGRIGVALTAVATVAFVMAPALLILPMEGPEVARIISASAIVIASAAVSALTVEQLHRERRTMVAIVGSVPAGLMLLDGDGCPIAVKRVETLRDLDRFIGESSGAEPDVFGPDGRTALAEADRPRGRARRGEEFDDQIVWLGSDPSTRRAMSVSARVVTDRHGAQTGASLASHDVTGFLQALAVKDGFIASVSHELRTPLTAVRGHLELALDRTDLDPDLRHHLDVSVRSAARLNRLVDDLLEAAQGRSGPLRLVRCISDIGELVRESAAALGPVLGTRRIRMEIDAPPGLDAMADPIRIGQVIDNLLSNAVKFSPEGGTVSVRLRRVAEDLTIVVVDQGPGMASEELPQLFTPFYRSASAIDAAVPGIGLGLSIVREIVTAHGGEVGVDTVAGQGATFSVRIPHGLPRGGQEDLAVPR